MDGCLLCYHNESLYILGMPQADDNIDVMHKFCLKTLTWVKLPQNGTKPIFHRKIFGTVIKNQLYCFEDPPNGTNKFREVRIFDFATNTWSKRTTKSKNQQYPSDRFLESFTSSNRFGYMSGGKTPDSNTYSSEIWKIDLETLEWLKLDYSLKSGCILHCMTILDDTYLYSYGACDSDSYERDTFESFIVRPPTLYRYCLEHIRRSPNLTNNLESLPTSIMNELILN
ncbi:Kelch domain-containing protein 10 [Thelohanellus kitauei]|uniref:Kelch domain-containing protein 10 n=1 Tax=Thelohanellus kitauei TaxID=669202 RepID=A0A0C2J085_THEKT|nr:Kelch domain-containing protein 10 [Thelohanellus kitauei]